MRLRRCLLLISWMIQLAGCAGLPSAPRTAHAPPAAQAFIAAALSMQGEPYRYGGDSPGGFDCSGLVAYAAQRAGLQIPRTASEQLRLGIPVRREHLRTGDLVFMRLPIKLHVGIITADGMFVHAPANGGRVRVDRLNAPPYRNGFIAARRILP